MEDVTYLPARELAARIRRRELTAVEALRACLERIAAHNPILNAVVSLDEDRALDAASAISATWNSCCG